MRTVKIKMKKSSVWLLFLLGVLWVGIVGCEKDEARAVSAGDGDADGDADVDNRPPTAGCGDGELTGDEACDDSNTVGGDGCSANCLAVEKGYSCNPPGKPCHLIARCGDGQMSLPELCDDGNLVDGDGCSYSCKVEIGFKCTADSPSVCTPTTCGDSIVEGAESCDDGNDIPFDGCSSTCQKEPDCSAGACASECGDGLVLGEECDDGNKINGDGCNDACQIEPGFECLQEGCTSDEDCTLEAAVIYRDFTSADPDFGGSCDGLTTGMVANKLDKNWKPVPTGKGCNIQNFNDWYNKPLDMVGTITLYRDASGNFVNRYGENGEPWVAYSNEQWCAPAEGSCDDCTCAAGSVCIPVNLVRPNEENPYMACATKVEYDGNPLFFPVDELNTDMDRAKVPEQYGFNGWPWEEELIPEAGYHNFYFTSELTYWFRFDAANPATLNFTGDDDVWVFVNGELVVDVGGVHVPEDGSVTIDASNNFGMVDGNVYKINIFHAERKMEGSSFKLTLGGFNTARSECRPECGDGIVGLGEECDDGVNDGGYGECGPNCRLSEFCGDGILQEEFEHCDTLLSSDCPNSCRIIIAE